MDKGKLPQDNIWTITLDNFYVGASPIAHLDILTEVGNGGHYSQADQVDITIPRNITQGPGLADLINGDQSGVVTELINFILDIPPITDVTFGISDTKLFKISPTTVINSSPFPHTITSSVHGESIVAFQGNLYYFYNTSGGGDIGKYDLNVTFDDDWGSTIPTGHATIENAKHPIAIKEDIMVFGNGRYVGVFFSDTNTIIVDQLDFGNNTEIADVAFYSNQWLIAVNSGVNSDTNRSSASLFLWDAGAISATLSDEISIGIQKIGFIKVFNGNIFICYKDIAGNNIFGYVSGRSILPLVYFTGDLPDYKQKTIYDGYIQFISDNQIMMAGYTTPDFPVSISPLASTGYDTAGAIAVPFGVPLISSKSGSNYRLAQFNDYSVASIWQSIIFPVSVANAVGYIDNILVTTNRLDTDAKCKLIIYANQNTINSNDLIIDGQDTQRHKFTDKDISFAQSTKQIEDFSIKLDWSNGDTENPCIIKKIVIKGHWVNK